MEEHKFLQGEANAELTSLDRTPLEIENLVTSAIQGQSTVRPQLPSKLSPSSKLNETEKNALQAYDGEERANLTTCPKPPALRQHSEALTTRGAEWV